MTIIVERCATRDEAPGLLLLWSDEGWLPSCSPRAEGRTDDGQEVLRFRLCHDTSSARAHRPEPARSWAVGERRSTPGSARC